MRSILLRGVAGVLAHGEVGAWDEILLYGGAALVLIGMVVGVVVMSRRFKAKISEEPVEEEPEASVTPKE